MEGSWRLLGRSGGTLGASWAVLGGFGDLLARSGEALGPVWVALGGSWRLLGRLLAVLGSALGGSWRLLGRSWRLLGGSGAALGELLAALGGSWRATRAFCRKVLLVWAGAGFWQSGSLSAALGAALGDSWVALGSSWVALGGSWFTLGDPWESSWQLLAALSGSQGCPGWPGANAPTPPPDDLAGFYPPWKH